METLTIEQAKEILINQFGVSEETINVVTNINGYNMEQMCNILYSVGGYNSFDQLEEAKQLKDKTMKTLIKNLNTLSKHLGFKGNVKSYGSMYGTAINTYGSPDASMWFFTINLNKEDLIIGIEVNSTYFKPNENVDNINKVASFDNPITFEQATNLIKLKPKY